AENHRPMDFEDARISEDFLRRGVSACPAGGTAAGRRSGQLDLFGEAAVLHVRVRLRSQIDVDVDVLVVHGLTVCDGCSRSKLPHDERAASPGFAGRPSQAGAAATSPGEASSRTSTL